MPDTLHRLVYYSHNRMKGTSNDLVNSIATILMRSRSNNAKVGVTGALMFNAGYFGQVLEGPRASIESVFERIQQDDRHGDVSLLAFDAVLERTFDQWSMGFVGTSIRDAALYEDALPATGYDPSRMDGDALYRTLARMAMLEERHAG